MIEVGERVTWPALRMVHNRMMIERAILRGRTEVRQALNRDRTTIDTGDGRDSDRDRQIDGLPGVNQQVPIESDADAGFALRSKKVRAARPTTSTSTASAEMFARGNGIRSRNALLTRRQHGTQAVQFPPSAPSGPPPAYSSSSGIGETLRHVRSSSLSAFASPFRRSAPDQASPEPEEPVTRKRSQRSISRWFGGASSSSEEEDQDDTSPPAAGDDTPTFSIEGPGPSGSALMDEPDSEEERGGVVPIPGGERVSQEEIDAGAAAGEGNLTGGSASGNGTSGGRSARSPFSPGRGSWLEQDGE